MTVATIGAFTMEQRLATSGMSEIHLVHETRRPNFKMVLKMQLTTGARDAFEQVLRQEATLLNQMRHPNIIRIYPLQVEGVKNKVFSAQATEVPLNPWYFVMEYVSGGDLETYTQVIKKFPLGWRLELFYQLLLTIEYMHDQGWAHCDLKPANILFRSAPNPNTMPRIALIDFGSLSPVDRLVRSSATVRYSSPEMLEAISKPALADKVVPSKVDIWALGAMLFEIVTGRPLINEQDKDRAVAAVMRGQYDDMQELDPTAPRPLSRMVNFMTQRDAARRPTPARVIEILEQDVMLPPFVKALG
jgi:serine/threonine protein kinase